MERIVLEVDDSAAGLFREFSLQTRRELGRAVSLLLKKAAGGTPLKDYMSFLDTIGNKAVTAGLTVEKLEELLKDDA